MAQDIHIEREHQLGLPAARELARQWLAQAEAKLGLQCVLQQGEEADEISFSRSGIKGTLQVRGDRFDLHAQLGFLLSGFAANIEAEISKNLDALLARPPVA